MLYIPQTYAPWKDIPTTYIVTEADDRALPLPGQMSFIEHARRQGADVTVVKLDTGHFPFLSKPEAVADIITKS